MVNVYESTDLTPIFCCGGYWKRSLLSQAGTGSAPPLNIENSSTPRPASENATHEAKKLKITG